MDFSHQTGSFLQRKSSGQEDFIPNSAFHRTIISTLNNRPKSRAKSPFTMITNPQAFHSFGDDAALSVSQRTNTASSSRAIKQRPQSALVRGMQAKKTSHRSMRLNGSKKSC